jgi:hypothetical protein
MLTAKKPDNGFGSKTPISTDAYRFRFVLCGSTLVLVYRSIAVLAVPLLRGLTL